MGNYSANMGKVTFKIKSNIYFEQGKKKVLPAAQVTSFFAMQVIGNEHFFKVGLVWSIFL